MALYWYLIIIALIFGAGWVTSFFVMRNNPKYFNIDKMAKEQLKLLEAKIKAKLN